MLTTAISMHFAVMQTQYISDDVHSSYCTKRIGGYKYECYNLYKYGTYFEFTVAKGCYYCFNTLCDLFCQGLDKVKSSQNGLKFPRLCFVFQT